MTKPIPCPRCGHLGQTGPQPNPEGQLMVYAQTAKNALCASCAATSFIKGIETLMWGIEKNGVQMLLNPVVQQGFAEVMKAGKADATPEEVNWQRVVDNQRRKVGVEAIPLMSGKPFVTSMVIAVHAVGEKMSS
jgi:hypothetical protein